MFNIICIYFTVIFEITSVLPNYRVGDQAGTERMNGESEIRKNFQNLFDSIANKDSRKGEAYRNVLKQEVARKRQAFDDMREDLQKARKRKFVNKQNFFRKSNINGRTVEMLKREANPGVPRTQVASSTNETSAQLEEVFKKKYAPSDDAHTGPYAPWHELQGATLVELEHVCKMCSKFVSERTSGDVLMTAAGEKSISNLYELNDSIVQLDSVKCSVSVVFNDEGAKEESEAFSLANGDQKNSAFKFTLQGLKIILQRKFTDVWPKNNRTQLDNL